MVCHETTEGAFPLIKKSHWAMGDPNRIALEHLFQLTRPKLFVHGHYHFYNRYEHAGCTFVCLRNADHFRPEIKQAEPEFDMLSCARECCLVADECGRIYEF